MDGTQPPTVAELLAAAAKAAGHAAALVEQAIIELEERRP